MIKVHTRTLVALALAALVSLPAVRASAQEKTEKKWYNSVKVKGDVRVRYERIDQEDRALRNRGRIRARLGAAAKPSDELDVEIGIATGSKNDPVSRNQTFTGGFTPKEFLLDYAYVDWHPNQIKGLSLQGGKLKNPFTTVSDIIWDGDVTPEGAALKYVIGADWKLGLVGGAFAVEERSADDDTMLYGAQAKVQGPLSERVKATVGVSYYSFQEVSGKPLIDPAGKSSSHGNSYVQVVEDGETNKLYAYDYQMIEPFASLSFAFPIPVMAFANYCVNTDPDDNNIAYAAGLKLGAAKDPNSWELAYMYKKVEKDATLGLLTDSDAWGGGTDGKGHKISATYQISKNWKAGITYFISKKNLADEADYNRLQLDLVAKF